MPESGTQTPKSAVRKACLGARMAVSLGRLLDSGASVSPPFPNSPLYHHPGSCALVPCFQATFLEAAQLYASDLAIPLNGIYYDPPAELQERFGAAGGGTDWVNG